MPLARRARFAHSRVMKRKTAHAHPRNPRPALGSLARALVQAGRLTEADAATLPPGDVARALVRRGTLDAVELARFVSQTFGYPRVALDALDLREGDNTGAPADAHTQASLPLRDRLLSCGVMPLARRGNRLIVAMADPTDHALLGTLRMETNLELAPVVADLISLQQAVDGIRQIETPVSTT